MVSCGMVSQSAASRPLFPFGNAITTDAARVREIAATIERPVTIRGRGPAECDKESLPMTTRPSAAILRPATLCARATLCDT